MKIIFDTDGTLTNFNKFINLNALKYFEQEYGMKIVNPKALELEDIFDMDNFFTKKYIIDKEEAKQYTKKAIDEFWINVSRFIKFSVLDKFREGATDFINNSLKNNHIIEVHTSRAKTTEDNSIGELVRKFTYLQYKVNGVKIPYNAFHFYKSDEEKVASIINCKPDLVFEDKPEIIEQLIKNGIKTICVSGVHNEELKESKLLKKVNDFNEIDSVIDRLLGNNKYTIENRVYQSDNFYKKVRNIRTVILKEFNPIIINQSNLLTKNENESILIAPNHQSTVDPLIITSIIDENIHWAALKRFFDAQDSIFNNNKNPLLCKLTAYSFKKFEYFPIERIKDNPKANNLKSLKDMALFLKNNQYVGIFPEGTTNKSKGKDFGYFEPSFITLAKNGNSFIQPVTVLWIKDLDIEHKVIINFAEPFKVENMSKEEAYKKYIEIQKKQLDDNKKLKQKLMKIKK